MSLDRQWVDIEEIQSMVERTDNANFLRRQTGEPLRPPLTRDDLARLKSKAVTVSGYALLRVLDVLENGLRRGEAVDEPEGFRTLTLSDTLARQLAAGLRDSAKEATRAD